MVKIIVEKNADGKKLIPYLQSKFNKLSSGSLYKALRNRDIRINDVKVTENTVLSSNDEITLYIKDEVLYGGNLEIAKNDIIYDDENIVIVNKSQNMLVESENDEPSMTSLLSKYYASNVFPCHRLDRNTSGLIIFAKDIESREILTNAINERNIKKYYKCLVYGEFKQKSATLKAYLFKDSKKSNVIISDYKKPGYVEIITKYKVIEKCKNTPQNIPASILEVELITGKTHQIRAHLAHINHPIIGDGKYGINEINKKFNLKYQELNACKLEFQEIQGKLSYLSGKIVEL